MLKPLPGCGIQATMGPADFIIFAAAMYAACGILFGILFAIAGVSRIDHAALGAPWSFRLLIWPGAAALWPLMLLKWVRAARSDPDGGHKP